jgi:hypothetical protein
MSADNVIEFAVPLTTNIDSFADSPFTSIDSRFLTVFLPILFLPGSAPSISSNELISLYYLQTCDLHFYALALLPLPINLFQERCSHIHK